MKLTEITESKHKLGKVVASLQKEDQRMTALLTSAQQALAHADEFSARMPQILQKSEEIVISVESAVSKAERDVLVGNERFEWNFVDLERMICGIENALSICGVQAQGDVARSNLREDQLFRAELALKAQVKALEVFQGRCWELEQEIQRQNIVVKKQAEVEKDLKDAMEAKISAGKQEAEVCFVFLCVIGSIDL